MARHNLSEAEALKAISTSDKERGNHYFRYTDQKWGKAQNYDVCINSGLMPFISGMVTVSPGAV